MEGKDVAMTVGAAERSTVLLVGDDIVNMNTLSTSSFSSMYQQMVIKKNCTSRMAAHVCYLLYYEVM